MSQVGIQSGYGKESSARLKSWLVFILLAFLLHLLLLFFLKLDVSFPPKPAPVEVHTVNPDILNRIRKQWKDKSLLISPQNQDQSKEAPKDARYFSDKNIQVEKEQRALNPVTLPKPGAVDGTGISHLKDVLKGRLESKTHVQPKSTMKHLQLGDLGIPFQLTAPDQNATQAPGRAQGGQQALIDDDLPTGSENLLNAQESIYYSFYARIYESIVPVWTHLVQTTVNLGGISEGEYLTAVEIVLDSDGNLLETITVQGSGSPQFDEAAVTCWRKVNRFQHPPRGLLDAKNQVHLRWMYRVNLQQGPQIQFVHPR